MWSIVSSLFILGGLSARFLSVYSFSTSVFVEMIKEANLFVFNAYELVREGVGVVIDIQTWKGFCLRQIRYILTSSLEIQDACSGKVTLFLIIELHLMTSCLYCSRDVLHEKTTYVRNGRQWRTNDTFLKFFLQFIARKYIDSIHFCALRSKTLINGLCI